MTLVVKDPQGEMMLHIVADSGGPAGVGTLVASTLCGRQLVVCGCLERELAEVDGVLCFGCKARHAGFTAKPTGVA
jgi:hypothetical protein